MKNVVVLFRGALREEQELKACRGVFPNTVEYRSLIPENSLVIPRYASLPFYKELEFDVKQKNSVLVNTYAQYKYVSDLRNYYEDLEGLTPETYFDVSDIPDSAFPVVLKGETNSRKFQWDSHMFAETREDAIRISIDLRNDSLLQYQNIYARKYVPLNIVGERISKTHPPIAEEYRIFIYNKKVIAGGFYWSTYYDDLNRNIYRSLTEILSNRDAFALILDAIHLIDNKINFYAIDIARTKEGDWIIVELNDGQMAGISTIDPTLFYVNLKDAVYDIF
jgi:hypothetical protein